MADRLASRLALRPRLLWGACLLLTGVGLFFAYLQQARTAAVNSDGASNALQAWDMLHGNLLLHGWYLSDVSFYTTELPEYMLVEAVRGLRPDVVHVSAALTYTLLVLLAALVGRGKARGRDGIIRAVVAGGIMVAPEIALGTRSLLSSPDHAGTGVPILLILLLLDRLRPRWYVPAAVLVLLTWVEMADQLAVYAIAAPLALVCLARALADSGRHDTPPTSRWHDASIAVAAVLSVGFARLAVDVIHRAGGFYVHPVPGPLLASPSAWKNQAGLVFQCVQVLFGAENYYQHTLISGLLAVLHVAGLALATWALLAAIVGFFRRPFFSRPDRVSQVLVVGTLVTLAAGVLGTHLGSLANAHEIAIVLPFGAALAGRMFPRRPVPGLRPLLAVVLACYLAALAWGDTWKPLPPDNSALESWLSAHGLTDGLAGYWEADSVTLDSGQRIQLSPVIARGSHRVGAYQWESDSSWYNPASHYANFVVTVPTTATEPAYLTNRAARRVFGRPAHVYQVGRYTIMVWNENLLARLGDPAA